MIGLICTKSVKKGLSANMMEVPVKFASCTVCTSVTLDHAVMCLFTTNIHTAHFSVNRLY